MKGQNKSPFKGASVEFVEHRQYYPGDEIRHIDWRAYGKTGKYYVKEYEDETNLRAYLLVDTSGSMGYSGRTLSKLAYARLLACALGYLLLQQRDAVGLMTFDHTVRERIEPSTRPQTFNRMTTILENCQPGGETSLSAALVQIRPLLKRRSLIVVLTDAFDDLDPLMAALRQFRHAHHEVVLLQIVAPEEEDFAFQNPTQFRSIERPAHRQLVDPNRYRAHYLERYQTFCEELHRQSGAARIDHEKIVTTTPFTEALGQFLDARIRGKAR